MLLFCSAQPHRPSSPAASANAAAISFSSSPDATFPTPTTAASAALRPSVVFRKVTGGFRSQWGADLYAATVSVIATARLHGRSAPHESPHFLL